MSRLIVAGRAGPAAGPELGEVFRDCTVCPEVVVVPSGTFMMGTPEGVEARYFSGQPQHVVTIEYSFAVGVYEVTFDEEGRMCPSGRLWAV